MLSYVHSQNKIFEKDQLVWKMKRCQVFEEVVLKRCWAFLERRCRQNGRRCERRKDLRCGEAFARETWQRCGVPFRERQLSRKSCPEGEPFRCWESSSSTPCPSCSGARSCRSEKEWANNYGTNDQCKKYKDCKTYVTIPSAVWEMLTSKSFQWLVRFGPIQKPQCCKPVMQRRRCSAGFSWLAAADTSKTAAKDIFVCELCQNVVKDFVSLKISENTAMFESADFHFHRIKRYLERCQLRRGRGKYRWSIELRPGPRDRRGRSGWRWSWRRAARSWRFECT